MVEFNEERSEERLKTLREQEEEALAKDLSGRYGVPYLDLQGLGVNIDALRVLKEEEARAAGLAIFDVTDKRLGVAVLSPDRSETKVAIEALKERGYTPEVYMVSHASLDKVYERYKDLSYSF